MYDNNISPLYMHLWIVTHKMLPIYRSVHLIQEYECEAHKSIRISGFMC